MALRLGKVHIKPKEDHRPSSTKACTESYNQNWSDKMPNTTAFPGINLTTIKRKWSEEKMGWLEHTVRKSAEIIT